LVGPEFPKLYTSNRERVHQCHAIAALVEALTLGGGERFNPRKRNDDEV